MSSRSYGGRTAEQRRADRRQRLVESATRLFAQDGYPATPIERICSGAGVSTRNFYEEFASREALLMEVYRQLTPRVWLKVVESTVGFEEASLRERAVRGLTTYIRETVSDPVFVRIIYVETVGVSRDMEDFRQVQRERWNQMVAAELDRAVERGEAVNRDYSIGVIGWLGAVQEITHSWWRSGRNRSVDQLEAELVHLAEILISDTMNHDVERIAHVPRDSPAHLNLATETVKHSG